MVKGFSFLVLMLNFWCSKQSDSEIAIRHLLVNLVSRLNLVQPTKKKKKNFLIF